MFYPFASLILLKTWSQKSFFIKHINLNFIFKNVVWKKKKKHPSNQNNSDSSNTNF